MNNTETKTMQRLAVGRVKIGKKPGDPKANVSIFQQKNTNPIKKTRRNPQTLNQSWTTVTANDGLQIVYRMTPEWKQTRSRTKE